MSFNVFDLLPDLDALRKKRAKRLEDAVGRGKVRGGFVSGFEHLTRPVKGAARTGSDTPLPQEAYRPQSGGGSGSPPPGDCPDPSQEPPPPPRASSLLAPPELTLRCTELDINGSITVRAGEFQKSELCAQHGLQARDLRKIDSKFVNQMPAILVRKHAILVNLLHIRALIEADRIVLFDSIGAPGNYSQSTLIFELQARLRSGSRAPGAPATDADSAQPFEFRALEAVLVSVVTTLQSDEEVLVNLVQSLLAYLEES
ncbi:magnesium ion transporter, partial [Coemansia spiralis]